MHIWLLSLYSSTALHSFTYSKHLISVCHFFVSHQLSTSSWLQFWYHQPFTHGPMLVSVPSNVYSQSHAYFCTINHLLPVLCLYFGTVNCLLLVLRLFWYCQPSTPCLTLILDFLTVYSQSHFYFGTINCLLPVLCLFWHFWPSTTIYSQSYAILVPLMIY
jgi:hypothetical protein